MRTRLLAFCLLLACGTPADKNGDGIADGVRTPTDVSQVAPSTPVGTLSGQTINTDFTPLDMVDVTAIVGGAVGTDGMPFHTTTKADGSFYFQNLPAGAQVQVTLTKAGYATARLGVTVPAAAGMFPLDNGNANVGVVALTQLTDEVDFQVITAAGAPAKGATAMLEVTPAAMRVTDLGSYGNGVGVVVINSDPADDTGVLHFKSVPGLREETRLNGQYTVTVAPLDVDGDKIIDFLGNRIVYSASGLYVGNQARTVITLPYAHASTPVNVIASNVDSVAQNAPTPPIKNMVRPGDDLYFVFDQPVIETSIDFKLTDELGTTAITTTRKLITQNILKVTATGTIEQGKEYNVALRVVSSDNGSTLSRTGYFFGGVPAMPMPFNIQKVTYKKAPGNMFAQPQPNDTIIVYFNQPIRNTGGSAVDVLIDADLNANGNRTDPGESGDTTDPSPWMLAPSEPVSEPGSTFTNMASGYTTRYEFVWAPGANSIAIGTNVYVRFSRVVSTLGEYRTIWDEPIEMDAPAMAITQP
jgi:hypothetical protein